MVTAKTRTHVLPIATGPQNGQRRILAWMLPPLPVGLGRLGRSKVPLRVPRSYGSSTVVTEYGPTEIGKAEPSTNLTLWSIEVLRMP